MKTLVTLLSLGLAAPAVFAAPIVSSQALQNLSDQGFASSVEATLENTRDGADKSINRTDIYYEFHVNYNLNADLNVGTGQTLSQRLVQGKDTNFQYDQTYLYATQKLSNSVEDGYDLRTNARLYLDWNDETRDGAARHGFLESRTSFGMPLAGNWSISRPLTYFRVQKSLNKQTGVSGSKDWAFRFRVTPEYAFNDQLAAGVRFQAQGDVRRDGGSNNQNVIIAPTVSYAIGNYFLSAYAEVNTFQSRDQQTFTKDMGDEILYGLFLEATLF